MIQIKGWTLPITVINPVDDHVAFRRHLGVAWREVEADRQHADVADEAELTFAGFLAFLDPPKPGAREALSALAELGVAVKVVTGDNEQVTGYVCG